jgi:hypothetical protein
MITVNIILVSIWKYTNLLRVATATVVFTNAFSPKSLSYLEEEEGGM